MTYPPGTIFTFSYWAINGESGNERASLWSDSIQLGIGSLPPKVTGLVWTNFGNSENSIGLSWSWLTSTSLIVRYYEVYMDNGYGGDFVLM